MNITNTTKRPLIVPLPGKKRLFLGPGKTGQITAKALDFAPLQALLEAGDLEVEDAANAAKSGPSSSGVNPARSAAKGSSKAGVKIRRSGDA